MMAYVCFSSGLETFEGMRQHRAAAHGYDDERRNCMGRFSRKLKWGSGLVNALGPLFDYTYTMTLEPHPIRLVSGNSECACS